MKSKANTVSAKSHGLMSAGVLLALSILGGPAQAEPSGMVVGWGYNEFGQCNPPPSNFGFVAIAGGNAHTLAVRDNGFVEAWGYDVSGQCTVLPPNTDFEAVAAGQSHSLGLKAGGWIAVWGANGFYGNYNVPPPNAGFIAISTSNLHNLALRSSGSIAAWGFNEEGACNVPLPNSGFVAVAAGGYHSLGLKANGSIVAWGRNNAGQCTVPEPNSGFVAIAAGKEFSLGLKSDGSIVGWGDNGAGQCSPIPEPNSGFEAIAAGYGHSLGLREDGSIEAWGENKAGQCSPIPQPNAGFVAIAAGWYHSLGIRTASETVFASSTSLGPGFVQSGMPADLNTSNDLYYVLRPGVVFTTSQSPIVLTASYTLPAGSASALGAVIESRAQQGNTRQTIEVFNFSTNSYTLLNQQVLPTTFPDTVVTSPMAPTASYIGAGNEVRLRISYRAIGPVFSYPWRVLLDEATIRFVP